ncbi:MAG: hypothetical protein ABI343_02920 [Burkholderiaceae bacterium]
MASPYPAVGADDIARTRAAADIAVEPLDRAGAVSWGAVIAGAAVAAALSLILLMLGVGLGLSSVSPWAYEGISAKTFGVSTILWLSFTQIVASAMGGYLAGRLRARWIGAHSDEVHFRDTAHGFLAWSVATLATAALLTSAVGSIVGTGAQAGASITGATVASTGVGAAAVGGQMLTSSTAQGAQADNSAMGYFVDMLFRKGGSDTAAVAGGAPAAAAAVPSAGAASASEGSSSAGAGMTASSTAPASSSVMPSMGSTQSSSGAAPLSDGATAAQVGRIFVTNLQSASLPPEDLRYVGQLVAERTGLSQVEAEKRVTETWTRLQARMQQAKEKALETADASRKAAAGAALWIFISLLIGAFAASLSATWGGRTRDF